MKVGISTHVFLQQRLSTALLDAMRDGGATTIEVCAARHHFDYVDRSAVREIAAWFRANEVGATLHQPLYTDAQWSRHVAPTVNLIDVEKTRRIDAMDEVKRAIESAEQIPFTAVVLHLGQKDDAWSPRSLEHSLTAIEHLKAFAHPLGVKVLLENLQNDVSTPEHLLEIVKVGHFDSVGFCLDVGHAHLAGPEKNAGVDQAFEALGKRIAHLHLHDNQGLKDEHLWPGRGTIDWKNVTRLIGGPPGGQSGGLPDAVSGVIEIAHEANESADSVARNLTHFLSEQERKADASLAQANV